MKRKIVIIGTGYVGLTAGVCLAFLGHEVICVDKDKDKIKNLKKGIIPIHEPGIATLLKKSKKNIEFTDNLKEALPESEAVFIAVGTPSKENGDIDLTHFKKAIREIAKLLRGYKVIVNKSTVPVGTGEWTVKEVRKYFKGKFAVVSNPEFLREGSAIKDFFNPDRIVIGTEDRRAKKIMIDIYSQINSPKIITNIKSAEMIKYAANAFLATKISFINEIANVCEKTGGDVEEVAKGIGLDRRIGKHFLKAGIGFGGSCFPKDVDGLASVAKKKKYDFHLLSSVSIVNAKQQLNFVRKIKKDLKKEKGKKICVWGLSFKPNTDDVRKSPALRVINLLKRYEINAYDPVATENAKKELGRKVKYFKDPLAAAKGADAVVLVTEWPEFKRINMKNLKKTMNNCYFFDGRNQLNADKMKKIGFKYYSIGRE
jgi:UDPglucose 6-dehydrogenase